MNLQIFGYLLDWTISALSNTGNLKLIKTSKPIKLGFLKKTRV